jgi:hypothetical protein
MVVEHMVEPLERTAADLQHNAIALAVDDVAMGCRCTRHGSIHHGGHGHRSRSSRRDLASGHLAHTD